MSAKDFKDKGNEYVKEKKYKEALECYSQAIALDGSDPILYSNRAAMHFNLSQFDKSLEDAEKSISLKASYGKGYLRKGNALKSLGRETEALEAFKLGLEKEPENQQLKEAVQELDAVINNPFMKNYPKLFTDPKTAGMMRDPQFKNMVDYALRDQKIMIQMVQADPRFMDVFSVLTGIDMGKMNEEAQKDGKIREEERKKKQAEDDLRKKQEAAERKKKEEEERWSNLSPEAKEEETNHKKADELKEKGNELYKKKNYDGALQCYNEAIALYPKEMSYYLNSARCYIEKKEPQSAIEKCNYVIENCSDFSKKATAYGIIGYAYQEQNDVLKAIEFFERSLLEKNDPRIKDALKEANNIKKRKEEEEYINPEIAEKENDKANDFFKVGKYPDALKQYNEAIKRNPSVLKYYTNRASCFIKLLEFGSAAKDCDKALELDPKSLRAFQRKANCHMMLKEYHKAMECIEHAQKLYPDDQELKYIYSKVIAAINSSSTQDDEERRKHAMADPEIQGLLKDPRIQQLFKDLQENPQSANDAIMKDEFIANAFRKLVASGIIKTK